MWLVRKNLSLQNVMQDWSIVLNGQAHKRDEFLENVHEEFEKRVHGVAVEDFVLGNVPLVQICHGTFHCNTMAIPFGKDLYVSWDMQSPKMTPSNAPGVLGALANAGKVFGYSEMKVGSAFGAVVLDCVRTAAEKILSGEAEKKKLAKQSSGLMGAM